MFKYEMHIHSNGCSACSPDDICNIIDAAKEKGYAGFVLTNHFYHGNSSVDRSLSWKEFVGAYKNEFLKAKTYGDSIGITVFFGLEEGVGKGKEALIYGVDADDIADTPAFRDMSLKEMSEFVHQKGGLIYAAHPFRDREYIQDPREEPDMSSYDGIEVHNCGNKREDNAYAADFALKNGIATITGGDTHQAIGFGKDGIATETPINSSAELIEVLKSGNYRLIINEEIV